MFSCLLSRVSGYYPGTPADESPKHHAPGSPYDHKDMLNGLKHTNMVDGSQHTAGIIKDSNEEYAQVSCDHIYGSGVGSSPDI